METDNYNRIVRHVAGILKVQRNNGNPAAFLTGAGASISANIPSAFNLVKQAAEMFPHCIEGLPSDARKDYGKCMSALSPDERRMLIKPYLDAAQINWGHIALAQIIKNGFVSRVLTFNFDLVLESALSLIGQQCPVYDFGAYPNADFSLMAEPSIIHLHGQSYGFVHLNTAEETRDHKDSISPLIASTINTRPTIIIGYSGDSDPSAKTLKNEYSDQKRLVWLDHSEVPNKIQHELTEINNYAEFSGGLDFDLFMIALATELNIWPPKILRNPSAHLLEELSFVTDYPVRDNKETDFFSRTKEHLGKQKDDPIVKAAFEGSKLPKDASKNEREINASVRASMLVREGRKLINQIDLLKTEDHVKILEASREKFEAAVKTCPESTSSYTHLGYVLTELAKRCSGKESEKLLNLAINNNKEFIKRNIPLDNTVARNASGTAYSNWGFALIELAFEKSNSDTRRLYELAIDKFEKSIELNPNNKYPYCHLAIALGRVAVMGSADDAKALFERAFENIEIATEVNPNDYRVYYCKARVLALTSDISEVIESLELAKENGYPNLKSDILKHSDFKKILKTDEIMNFLKILDD